MTHPKLPQVRQRYSFRCGYCGVTEVEAGGELTVDHYRPPGVGGDEGDENLVYSCPRCNLYKGDFYPTPADLALGLHVLHPMRHGVDDHLREDPTTGELMPLTITGRFHLALLHLNRPALVARRLHQRLAALIVVKQRLLEQENAQLRAMLTAQEEYLVRLRRVLGYTDESTA